MEKSLTAYEDALLESINDPLNQLKAYLKRGGLSIRGFAAQIEVNPSHLNEIINLKRGASATTALKIQEVTGISAISIMRAWSDHKIISEIRKTQALVTRAAQDEEAA